MVLPIVIVTCNFGTNLLGALVHNIKQEPLGGEDNLFTPEISNIKVINMFVG